MLSRIDLHNYFYRCSFLVCGGVDSNRYLVRLAFSSKNFLQQFLYECQQETISIFVYLKISLLLHCSEIILLNMFLG